MCWGITIGSHQHRFVITPKQANKSAYPHAIYEDTRWSFNLKFAGATDNRNLLFIRVFVLLTASAKSPSPGHGWFETSFTRRMFTDVLWYKIIWMHPLCRIIHEGRLQSVSLSVTVIVEENASSTPADLNSSYSIVAFCSRKLRYRQINGN